MFKDVCQLFYPVSRVKLLKFFSFDGEARGEGRATAAAAASTVGITKEEAERQIRAFMRLKLLTMRRQGSVKTYVFNNDHPFAGPLRRFLEETTLPSERAIAKAFKGVTGIISVIASGNLAKEPRSSADLLIVTRRPEDARLAAAVRKVETLSGIMLRYAVLGVDDYHERLEARDRLIRDVLEYSHRVIIGRK